MRLGFNIPRPNGKREVITKYQTASDIIKQLRRAELESRNTSKKIAPFFKSKSDFETCKKVWEFLRKHIEYEAEPKHDQTAKTINRFIVDRKGDCKHFATASVGILIANKIPAWFVLVGQQKLNPSPNHAYCCALVNNEIVVIDPCRKKFNSECNFYWKYQYGPKKNK